MVQSQQAELMTEGDFKKLLGNRTAALKNFLGSEQNALKFMSAVMHAVQKTPKLLECDKGSLLGAFMECAALNLYPNTHSGECDVLPYNIKGKMVAQFQLGYKGVRTLAYRSGVARCGAEIVYENDKFKKVLGTSQKLEHEPADGDRGAPVGSYAWAEVTPGAVIFEHMTEEEIMNIAKMSPSYKADMKYKTKKSLWINQSNDPQLWMWKKTVFKQLGKMLPSSDQLSRAVYLDNISERGGYIKDEGEVVEVPFDTQEDKIERGKDKKEALRNKKKEEPEVVEGEVVDEDNTQKNE